MNLHWEFPDPKGWALVEDGSVPTPGAHPLAAIRQIGPQLVANPTTTFQISGTLLDDSPREFDELDLAVQAVEGEVNAKGHTIATG